ncbi:hypothetical protein HYS84_02025 [Candidatus Saccharibacteria bacterium]|nr:hypothetical protein [Candidatus Saccharibacteria bacterium]
MDRPVTARQLLIGILVVIIAAILIKGAIDSVNNNNKQPDTCWTTFGAEDC